MKRKSIVKELPFGKGFVGNFSFSQSEKIGHGHSGFLIIQFSKFLCFIMIFAVLTASVLNFLIIFLNFSIV